MRAAISAAAAVLLLVMMTAAANDWDDDDVDSIGAPPPRHCLLNKDCRGFYCPVGQEAVCSRGFPHYFCVCRPIKHKKYCKKDKDCHCKPGQLSRCLKKPHCDIGRCVCEPRPRPKPAYCKKTSDCKKACPAGTWIYQCHKKPHCDIGECICIHR